MKVWRKIKLFLVLLNTHIQAEPLPMAINICLYSKKAKLLFEESSLEEEKTLFYALPQM